MNTALLKQALEALGTNDTYQCYSLQYKAAKAIRAHLASPTPDTCQWTPMDDEYMPDSYDTSCGQTWSFIEGGIAENGIKFCHNCGKRVIEVPNSKDAS